MTFLSRCHIILQLAVALVSGSITTALAVDPAELATFIRDFSRLTVARSETLAIMGGDDGFSSGFYTFYADDSSLSITKFGGKGVIGKPHRTGVSGITWQPILGGTVGYISGKNEFKLTPLLAGNTETFYTIALGGEAGVKISLTDEISIAPTIGLLYSYAGSSFSPRTAQASELKQQYAKQLFDWDAQTISFSPALEATYEKVYAKDMKLTLSSRYAWFNTWEIASSSRYLDGEGSSSSWENRIDLDLRLPMKLLGFPLHTGGYVSLDMVGGNFREVIQTNAIYTFNGRLVLGDLGGLWNLDWLGLGLSYIKASTFYGYSVGLDVRLKF